jgi:phosphatidylinositol-4,5-bisphosphate 3-kinase
MMPGRALPPVPCGEVDLLLPTGMMVTLSATPSTTLRQLKDRLYQEAKQHPLFSLLKDQGFYNFLGITRDGEKEEFVNEEMCLEDLNLYAPVLKLVEREGNQEEKQLNSEISNLIGRRTCMHDFDTMGTEAQDFRRGALAVCEQAVTQRTQSESTAMRYYYPPNLLDYQPRVDHRDSEISVSVDYLSSDGTRFGTTILVDLVNDPRSVLELALNSREFKPVASRLDANSFVLKVVGKEEYFLKEVPIIQYKYIAACLAKKVQPRFSLKLYDDLRPKEKEAFIRPVYAGQQQEAPALYGTRTRATSNKDPSHILSIMEVQDTYKIKILSAKNANTPENLKVYVKAGIYHGRESLCSVVTTSKGAASENTEWNEILEFDISIRDIPRGAKLCFVVSAAPERGKSKRKKAVVPLAWVNMMVYDYEGRLQTGRQELYAWPCGSELEEDVNFMGSNLLNLSTSEDVSVEIEVIEPCVGVAGKPIMYPTEAQINKFALEMSQVSIPASKFKNDTEEMRALQKVIEGDPLTQLDEQDKELIWRARNVCLLEFPQSLPKLLQSVCWNNRSEVAQVYFLLQKWRPLSPESALELLDHQYGDIQVRDRAVEWLECLGDNKLIMYLLQLVQALKFEPYLDCALGQFLLRRALQNKVIGHFLFWHLR